VIFPKTFNEKILAKMLFDRSPLLLTAADKLTARALIAKRIGEKYLPKVYAVWPSPASIELDPTWGPVAIKANHGSGFVKLISNSADANLAELRELAATWCKIDYGRTHGEWCYRGIKPRLYAEELVGTEDPDALMDYKFYCFAGQPRFLNILRGGKGKTRSYYANLECKDLQISDGRPALETEYQRAPPNFELMLDFASRISSDFDMVRIDMYNLNGTVYVGELTNYPRAGMAVYGPKGADLELGRYWERSSMTYLPFSGRSRDQDPSTI
jgi:hypothetical protein